MEDIQNFNLAVNGKSVDKIEWKGGLAARDQLSKGAIARTKK